MDIFIEKLHIRDAEDLLKFELENRTFFEEMVPTEELTIILLTFLIKT